jgi:hypothetical protein
MGIVDDAFGKRLGELRQLELELTRNPHHNEVRDVTPAQLDCCQFLRKAGIQATKEFNVFPLRTRVHYPLLAVPEVNQLKRCTQASGDASTSKTQMLAFERKAQLLAQVAEKRAQKVSGSLVRQFRDELKNRSMVRSLGRHGAIPFENGRNRANFN